MIDFDDQERRMLRTYFDALDRDSSGSIDVSELEEVMVALGLAEKHSDVEKMLSGVDEDDSGEIEFHEFLSILRRGHSSNDPSSSAMFKVFKSLIRGNLGDTENLGFKLLTSVYRRKRIMDAMMAKRKSVYQVLTKDGGVARSNGPLVSDAYFLLCAGRTRESQEQRFQTTAALRRPLEVGRFETSQPDGTQASPKKLRCILSTSPLPCMQAFMIDRFYHLYSLV
ncbi:hypothetical protein FOZ63_026148 [Perkinsus olseni]|nr:hypothetical protein FOZ63_026148 [Perkinsus olseni]